LSRIYKKPMNFTVISVLGIVLGVRIARMWLDYLDIEEPNDKMYHKCPPEELQAMKDLF